MTRPAEERFWEKVDKSGNCWLWTAGKTSKGYGNFKVKSYTNVQAHEFSFFLVHGYYPKDRGHETDHTCRIRTCVNPDHLEEVTGKVNTLRGESFSAKKARMTRCAEGHEFSWTWEKRKNGERKRRRYCPTCARERRYARQKLKGLTGFDV